MFKYQRATETEDYVHFYYVSNVTGRAYELTVTDELIQKAMRNTDSWCEVFDKLYKDVIEKAELRLSLR